MQRHVAALEFEQAAKVRDSIRALQGPLEFAASVLCGWVGVGVVGVVWESKFILAVPLFRSGETRRLLQGLQ